MHKGIRHKTRKNKSYKGLKNKSYRGLKNKSYRGGMGATEHVSSMYGDLNQQFANATDHMQLSPIKGGVPTQSGGKSKRKGKRSFRVPQQSGPSRLAGGNSDDDEEDKSQLKGGAYYPLNPAEYGGQVGALSDGQKGGYITQLLERAAVPFGLMALQRYAGKRSRKNRK